MLDIGFFSPLALRTPNTHWFLVRTTDKTTKKALAFDVPTLAIASAYPSLSVRRKTLVEHNTTQVTWIGKCIVTKLFSQGGVNC